MWRRWTSRGRRLPDHGRDEGKTGRRRLLGDFQLLRRIQRFVIPEQCVAADHQSEAAAPQLLEDNALLDQKRSIFGTVLSFGSTVPRLDPMHGFLGQSDPTAELILAQAQNGPGRPDLGRERDPLNTQVMRQIVACPPLRRLDGRGPYRPPIELNSKRQAPGGRSRRGLRISRIMLRDHAAVLTERCRGGHAVVTHASLLAAADVAAARPTPLAPAGARIGVVVAALVYDAPSIFRTCTSRPT